MSGWLDVRPDAIPPALREQPWVVWRAEQRGDGKPTKVPYQIACPSRKASSTDPSTWGTFDDAVDAQSCPELALDGIGVVLTSAARITCIDLDRVLVDDELDPRAAIILARAGAPWAEISPSGTGLHIFVRGRVPRALKGDQIEVYSDARYIAITGHRWPDTADGLLDGQRYLDALVRLHADATRPTNPSRPFGGRSTPPPDDLAGALLAKLEVWGVQVDRLKRWSDGFLVELVACPWADEHTTGPSGAAVAIHASGAFDFVCQHAHCGRRRWGDFRAVMERG